MTAKILVVENEVKFQRTIKELLRSIVERGGQLSWAKSAKEALEKAISFNPDVIFVSMDLPEREGFKVIEQIEQNRVLSPRLVPYSENLNREDIQYLNEKPNIAKLLGKSGDLSTDYLTAVALGIEQSFGPQKFDYTSLDLETQQFVRERADKIKALMKRSAQDVIDIGKYLLEVKERLDYGQFGEWIDQEFSYSYPLAAKFMQVAREFSSITLIDLSISSTALYLLAQTTTPQEVREEALDQARRGVSVTPKLVQELLTETRGQSDNSDKPIEFRLDNTNFSEESKNLSTPSKDELTVQDESPDDENTFSPVFSEFSDNSQAKSVRVNQEVISSPTLVIPEVLLNPGEFWQLSDRRDRHLLYCGSPKSATFSKRLPSDNIDLLVSFPPTKDSWLNGVPEHVKQVLMFYLDDLKGEEFTELFFQFISKYTREDHFVVFAYLPSPRFFLSASELGCNCFLADPKVDNCLTVISAWQRNGGTVFKLPPS